jgi:hypothetical protein
MMNAAGEAGHSGANAHNSTPWRKRDQYMLAVA